jgi:hypothetical protein
MKVHKPAIPVAGLGTRFVPAIRIIRAHGMRYGRLGLDLTFIVRELAADL